MRRLARWILRRGKKAEPVFTDGSFHPRILIFDFDGTLADTFEAGIEILNKLADDFKFRRLPPEEVSLARGMTVRQLIKHLGVPTSKVPKISLQGIKELRARIDTIKPIAGIIDVVHELKNRGYVLGIVTSNAEENVGFFLKRHGLECFEFIRTSSRLLGKARVIRSVMREYKYKPEEMLLIGDECRDIEAAKRTKVPIVAVTWGYNTRESMEVRYPQFMVTNPQELLSLLERN